MAVLRRLRYSVAMSLDGYIAGPDGEYDWIVMVARLKENPGKDIGLSRRAS